MNLHPQELGAAVFTSVMIGLIIISLANSPFREPLFSQSNFLKDTERSEVVNRAKPILESGLTLSWPSGNILLSPDSKDFVVSKMDGIVDLDFTKTYYQVIEEELHNRIDESSQNFNVTSADISKVGAVTFSGKIQDGEEVIWNLSHALIADAVQKGKTQVSILTRIIKGKVVNQSGLELGPLEYLARGRSNFTGSSADRAFNVRKAINEHYNGVLIPPGVTFSYLELLGPVTNSEGWHDAYSIFNATELDRVPGGGICQVSTTVYRAALFAGLPITEQRNHSLYISYYEDYGDGLDATIFPGEQDLKFTNDTPNYLLMVAQEEDNQDIVISFYGESDGRTASLFGPYTASNQTEETFAEFGKMGIGKMAWRYTLTLKDGSEETRWLLSNYFSKAHQYREDITEPLNP